MVAVGSPYQPGSGIYTSVDTIRQEVGVSTSRHSARPPYLCLPTHLFESNPRPPFNIFVFVVWFLLLQCWAENAGLRCARLRCCY